MVTKPDLVSDSESTEHIAIFWRRWRGCRAVFWINNGTQLCSFCVKGTMPYISIDVLNLEPEF